MSYIRSADNVLPDLLSRWYISGDARRKFKSITNNRLCRRSISEELMQFHLVISEAAEERLQTLERLARDMVNFANAPGTNANKKSQEKRYYNFCDWLELNKFPVDE